MEMTSDVTQKAPWITYRPEIKVLDCTIRDGGLMNNHQFDDSLVKAVYETCVEAGIDYMEIGYKASKRIFARDQYGDWKYCDEDDVRRIVGENATSLKLAAMADAGKTDYKTGYLAQGKECVRHDSRRLLRAPVAGSCRHDSGRPRQGL